MKWWQENILDQSQKKKKNRGKSSPQLGEKHHRPCLKLPQELPGAPQPKVEYCVGTRGQDQGSTRVARGRNHGMPDDTVMSHFEKTKQNIKNQPFLSFNWSSCLLKTASVYSKQPLNVPSDNRSCWFCLSPGNCCNATENARKRRLRKFSFLMSGR